MRAPSGEAPRTLERLLLIETDDCIEWPWATTEAGYGLLYLTGRLVYVHRLALERRVGPPSDPRMEAAHGPCHNPPCMNYRHLRWATKAQNMADRLRDGTDQNGERNVQAKLTQEQVALIRAARPTTRVGVLARQFQVSPSTICDIVAGRSWATP